MAFSPFRQERLDLAQRMLADQPGIQACLIRSACKRRYGFSIGYESIERLRNAADSAQSRTGTPVKPIPSTPPSSITEVPLPLEFQIPSDFLADTGPSTVPSPRVPSPDLLAPVVMPKGTTSSFLDIQAWMQSSRTEQVILNKDGSCSVLAWHHFNVGGSANG